MMRGYGGMGWGMGLVSVIVLRLFVLGVAALVKHLKS
jgi:hypothetical protein